jgi:hypothetical protein
MVKKIKNEATDVASPRASSRSARIDKTGTDATAGVCQAVARDVWKF